MSAIIKSGATVCSGQNQHLYDIDFKPDFIFAKLGTGASPWMWWSDTSWCQRTQRVGAADSFLKGLMGVDQSGRAVLLGDDSQANIAGQTLYWLAIADNGSGTINTTGWIGNSTGQTLLVGSIFTSGAAAAVRIKRDNNLEPAYRATGMSRTAFYGGAATSTTAITAINADGSIVVSTDSNVNQLAGAAIGEGHDCFATWEKTGVVEHFSYTGNSTPGRNLTLKDNWQAIEIVADTTGVKAGFKTKDMPANFICAADSNVYTDAITSSGNILQFGTNNIYNTSGTTYYVTVFYRSQDNQKIESIPRSATKKAVVLRGASTSNINCGTSDTLSITGAHSFEWWGQVRSNTINSSTTYSTIFARSMGTEGRASAGLKGTWSEGLFAARPNDLGDWAGNQFVVLTTDYNNIYDNSGSENNILTKPWRTGILVPFDPFHVVYTTDGLGGWRLYLNGKLVKQRRINMTGVSLADGYDPRVNAGVGSGHTTAFGARWNGTAMGQLGKITMLGASLYSAELTPTQVRQLYRRNFLEDTSQADVTPLERWLADNASGTLLPASINSVNNGTISSSAGVVLRDPWLYSI